MSVDRNYLFSKDENLLSEVSGTFRSLTATLISTQEQRTSPDRHHEIAWLINEDWAYKVYCD